jgi:hypothetical protein
MAQKKDMAMPIQPICMEVLDWGLTVRLLSNINGRISLA